MKQVLLWRQGFNHVELRDDPQHNHVLEVLNWWKGHPWGSCFYFERHYQNHSCSCYFFALFFLASTSLDLSLSLEVVVHVGLLSGHHNHLWIFWMSGRYCMSCCCSNIPNHLQMISFYYIDSLLHFVIFDCCSFDHCCESENYSVFGLKLSRLMIFAAAFDVVQLNFKEDFQVSLVLVHL